MTDVDTDCDCNGRGMRMVRAGMTAKRRCIHDRTERQRCRKCDLMDKEMDKEPTMPDTDRLADQQRAALGDEP